MLSSYVVVGATVVVLEPLLLATAAAMAASPSPPAWHPQVRPIIGVCEWLKKLFHAPLPPDLISSGRGRATPITWLCAVKHGYIHMLHVHVHVSHGAAWTKQLKLNQLGDNPDEVPTYRVVNAVGEILHHRVVANTAPFEQRFGRPCGRCRSDA